MNKAEKAAQMLAWAKEKYPKREIKRGKVWVDANLQVARSWLAKAISKEHKERNQK